MPKILSLGTIALLNKKIRSLIINKKGDLDIYEKMQALKMTGRHDSQ